MKIYPGFGRSVLSILLLFVCHAMQAQMYMSKNGNVSFYSKAPLEDIEAHSNQMSGIIKADTREVAFSMPIKSYQFEKSLMQEHFNDKFLESDKYPNATFTGNIVEDVDLSRTGIYHVNVKGVLTIHGVPKNRTLEGRVVSDGTELKLTSDFKVKVADHKIKIPKLVFKNIAEVVDVKLNMTLTKQ